MAATKEEIWEKVCEIMYANPEDYGGRATAPPGYFGPWSSNDYAKEIFEEMEVEPPPETEDLKETAFKKMKRTKPHIKKEKIEVIP